MTATVAYYNRNAARYVAETVEVELSVLRERFLAQIPTGGFILDAGCGSGRDSLAFLQRKRPGNPGSSAYSCGAGILRSSGVSRSGSSASMPSGVVTVGRVSNR
jgi:hypothetical protein